MRGGFANFCLLYKDMRGINLLTKIDLRKGGGVESTTGRINESN